MTCNGSDYDSLFAAVATLTMRDVDERRANRLRSRCHNICDAQRRRHARDGTLHHLSFRRGVAPAAAGVWCVVYLAEIIRRAAEIYGF